MQMGSIWYRNSDTFLRLLNKACLVRGCIHKIHYFLVDFWNKEIIWGKCSRWLVRECRKRLSNVEVKTKYTALELMLINRSRDLLAFSMLMPRKSRIFVLFIANHNYGLIRGKCARPLYTHVPDGMCYRPSTPDLSVLIIVPATCLFR